MKRFLWMFLIFIFILSLTAFASENTEVEKTEKPAIEKVGKKVSEMPKVHVGKKSVKSEASQVIINSSNEQKALRKPYVKKKNVVNNKLIQKAAVQVKTTD